jgi:hypothetical protein
MLFVNYLYLASGLEILFLLLSPSKPMPCSKSLTYQSTVSFMVVGGIHRLKKTMDNKNMHPMRQGH